jgi:hypothetical protein
MDLGQLRLAAAVTKIDGRWQIDDTTARLGHHGTMGFTCKHVCNTYVSSNITVLSHEVTVPHSSRGQEL